MSSVAYEAQPRRRIRSRAADAVVAMESLGLLFAARLAVRQLGLRRSVAMMGALASRPHRLPRVPGPQPRVVAIACTVFARTTTSCIERALALWTMLRMRRWRPDLCVGFGPPDDPGAGAIGGHAWVELDGVVLGDSEEHVRGFHVVSRNGERAEGA